MRMMPEQQCVMQQVDAPVHMLLLAMMMLQSRRRVAIDPHAAK
jgi:hypothetical protein